MVLDLFGRYRLAINKKGGFIMEKNIVATVDASGIVEVANDRATFTLNIKTKAEHLETAKEQIQERVSFVIKTLKALNMNLDCEIVSSIANYKLEHREGGERYPAGFQSVATIAFTTVIDEKLDSIYEVCNKIDSNITFPIFSIKDRDTLLKQATDIAAKNVKDRLAKECELLNIDANELKVLSWHFGYDGTIPANSYGMMGATGAQGPMGHLNANAVGVAGPGGYQATVSKLGSIYQELLDTKLNPGTVSVKVVVQVSYIWNE